MISILGLSYKVLQTSKLQQFSLQSPNTAFALHSAIIGYILADQKMLFGNTLLPAPNRLHSSKCIAAAAAKQPESAAMLRIDHGVVDPFSEKASKSLEAKLLCRDLSDSILQIIKNTTRNDHFSQKLTFHLAAKGVRVKHKASTRQA